MNNFRLLTIPMSHYCEKARWGLERLGISYYEERHMQAFHYPRTWWVSKGPMVPVLQHGDRVISDSTAILKYLDGLAPTNARLYPDDPRQRKQVEALEDLFDEELGVESRRFAYFHFLDYPQRMLALAGQGVPALEKILTPPLFPLMRRFAGRLLQPTRERVDRGLQRCREICAMSDRLLAEKGDYLLGDDLTAADLSLACMMAPLVVPENYGIRLPGLSELPTLMRREVMAFRQTRTGGYVLELFATERLKTGDASQNPGKATESR